MKRISVIIILLATALTGYCQKNKPSTYRLITIENKLDEEGRKYKAAVVNQKAVDKLNEPLRALAAYYTCWIQCNCEFDSGEQISCELTRALGLGDQGSEKQIAILQKWFPSDNQVQSAIDMHCWVGMPGSSNFLEYSNLTFLEKSDTVKVSYRYIRYDHGATSTIVKNDVAVVRKDRIVFLKR